MTLPMLITSDSQSHMQRRRSRVATRYAAIGSLVRLQGCNWFKCAGIVAGCITACASGPAACAVCLGAAYEECKDCL